LSAALSAAAQPRAQVRIVDQAGNPLPDVPFRVLRPEDNRVVGSFEGTGAIPAGAYLVEILGDNSATQTITALEGETVDVVVEVPMFGQLQLVKPDGSAINDMQLSAANAETGEAAGSALGALSLAPGIYTVTVNAIVPFTVTAEVKVDETTPIVVDVLAGTIALVDADGNPVEGVTAIITHAESGETLYANSNGVFIVPPGVFDVEIRGINPFETQVTVAADETVEIVVDLSSGFIQLVDADGNPVEGVTAAITQAENADRLFTNDRGRYEVPVGTFEVEVLGLNPFTTEVTVAAGETVEVVVELASGVIQLVDADGNPIEGVTAVITRAESGETLYANSNGVFIVPPGVIDVEIRGLNPFETQVTVGADETVEIEVDVTSGFIQLVDENVNPVRGVTAYITDVARDITLYANDRGLYEVPLGLIRVEFRTTDPATIVDVELTTDGETAEVTVP
jgi:hypothetical protein